MNRENSFHIRKFDPERDADAAYRGYVSGFYHNSWPFIDHAEPRLIKDMMTAGARAADVTFVAEADGEARGMLMGYYPDRPMSLVRAVLVEVCFQLLVLLRRYKMEPLARVAWWRMVRGELSFVMQHRGFTPEVLFLTSQKEYRGGIGRALMDAWVEETRSRGYDETIVGTDSTVSWDFYERYGFKRECDFPLKSFVYSLPGQDVRGYIYSLDI